MNTPDEPEPAPQMIPDMAQWRAAIDRHDDEILALIQSRLALSEEVGKTKASGALAWRPAREARLFARLVSRAGRTMSPQAVQRLWSTIIAQSLQAQGPAFLLVARTDPALPALARSFFGLLPLHTVKSHADALSRCQTEEGGIAILPAPGTGADWWLQLAQGPKNGQQGPAVLAALPRFAADGPTRAYAVACAPRELSGSDTAWYVAKEAADLPHGHTLANAGKLRLVAVNGARPIAQSDELCQIGVFANPL